MAYFRNELKLQHHGQLETTKIEDDIAYQSGFIDPLFNTTTETFKIKPVSDFFCTDKATRVRCTQRQFTADWKVAQDVPREQLGAISSENNDSSVAIGSAQCRQRSRCQV